MNDELLELIADFRADISRFEMSLEPLDPILVGALAMLDAACRQVYRLAGGELR